MKDKRCRNKSRNKQSGWNSENNCSGSWHLDLLEKYPEEFVGLSDCVQDTSSECTTSTFPPGDLYYRNRYFGQLLRSK